VPLLSVENLGDAKTPSTISSVFADQAPKEKSATSASYSVGVVYADNSELRVTVRASANGNGVILDYGDMGKKAYFFGNISSQLSDFIAGINYTNKIKIESNGAGLSITRTDDGTTMKSAAGSALYVEYSGKGGFLHIASTPPG
jgi:hypothetical protein